MRMKATHLPTGKCWEFTESDLYAYEGEICGILFNEDVLPNEIRGLNDALMFNGRSGYGISKLPFISQETGVNLNLLIEAVEE